MICVTDSPSLAEGVPAAAARPTPADLAVAADPSRRRRCVEALEREVLPYPRRAPSRAGYRLSPATASRGGVFPHVCGCASPRSRQPWRVDQLAVWCEERRQMLVQAALPPLDVRLVARAHPGELSC